MCGGAGAVRFCAGTLLNFSNLLPGVSPTPLTTSGVTPFSDSRSQRLQVPASSVIAGFHRCTTFRTADQHGSLNLRRRCGLIACLLRGDVRFDSAFRVANLLADVDCGGSFAGAAPSGERVLADAEVARDGSRGPSKRVTTW